MENSRLSSSDGLVDLFPRCTNSAEETQRLGRQVAAFASPGDIFALAGPVGSGKTQFVKGICDALGIDVSDVTSPTFAIAHEYEGYFNIVHLDLYRLDSEAEVIDIGFEDYLSPGTLAIIEWPEVAKDLLPTNTLVFAFEHLDNERRRIRLLNPDAILPTRQD